MHLSDSEQWIEVLRRNRKRLDFSQQVRRECGGRCSRPSGKTDVGWGNQATRLGNGNMKIIRVQINSDVECADDGLERIQLR